MKKKLLYVGMLITSVAAFATDENFNVTMKLLAPIVITEVTPLTFPNTLRGAITNVVVLPADAAAASFTATGSASTAFTKSVVQTSIIMQIAGGSAGDLTKEIVVDTFTLAGPTAFDATGNATGLKVGATAHVLANDLAGNYSGTATFRIIY